jgi:hypothetical protein
VEIKDRNTFFFHMCNQTTPKSLSVTTSKILCSLKQKTLKLYADLCIRLRITDIMSCNLFMHCQVEPTRTNQQLISPSIWQAQQAVARGSDRPTP